jgi:Spy/CpxP family protein refolding chaperone
MKTASRWLSAAVLLGLLALPATADAQRRGDPASREQIEQRIRAQMGRMMQQRLGLDAAEAEELSAVVRSFDERRREIMQREVETRRRVGALQSGDTDEAEARELLELQAQLRLQEAELFREEQEALLDVLTPSQVLELQDLRQDIGRRIRALRGGGRPDADRRRGPGPDGRIGSERPTRPGPPLG